MLDGHLDPVCEGPYVKGNFEGVVHCIGALL